MSKRSANQRNQRNQTPSKMVSVRTPFMGVEADSIHESNWLSMCEHTFGNGSWTHHPKIGYRYTPDILVITPIGPLVIEVKKEDSTGALALHETRSYQGMIGSSLPMLLVGSSPLISVTDPRCDGSVAYTAAISQPGKGDQCGLWKWAQNHGDIMLIPHCAPIEPLPDGKVIDLWLHALAARRYFREGDEPGTGPAVQSLPFDDDGLSDETTAGGF